ncbi:ATPase involved in DNA repair [hydrothermal vent metagenome]|uniref:ATPase involved in DNA repair n=1 Tax=hydrothermal vent metagenome TaxID=652676 RepID=A0A1W1C253_9ZZZZ
MKKDLLREKSFAFALRIIKLSQYLQKEHKEYILSKQVIRSGTSIGALIREAQYAQSKADFLHKLTIALKEANETEYWLLLLNKSGYLDNKMLQSIQPEIDELLKLLISSTKKIKENLK